MDMVSAAWVTGTPKRSKGLSRRSKASQSAVGVVVSMSNPPASSNKKNRVL